MKNTLITISTFIDGNAAYSMPEKKMLENENHFVYGRFDERMSTDCSVKRFKVIK